MERDKRYKTVKFLIEGGHVNEFNQIFDHIPKSVVANDLGTNYNRLNKLVSHVDFFVLKDLFILSTFFDISEEQMIKLVLTQRNNNKDKNGKEKKK